MTRLGFIKGSAALLADASLCGCCAMSDGGGEYSVTLLGDTHFDGLTPEVYHSKWVPRGQNDWRGRQNEFKRNAEMWSDRLPRLIAAAARTRPF